MRTGMTGDDRWRAGVAMFMIAPLLVIFGAVVVMVLATPVIVALTAIAFGVAVLMVGTTVTRQEASLDYSVRRFTWASPLA